MLFKKLTISFVLSISMIFSIQSIYAADLIPGGDSIGINLDYEGVVITGGYEVTIDGTTYNPMQDGLQVGDTIIKANGTSIDSIAELMRIIKESITSKEKVMISVKRGSEVFERELSFNYNEETNQFSTGLYVKDCLMGVGTMTYYNPATSSFGSLGHAMYDVELDDQALVKTGSIYRSNVTGIRKGDSEHAGQKIATISDVEIGEIDGHSQFGIYGTYDDGEVRSKTTMETASISEVKLGKAYFLTVLHGEEIVECQIEITALEPQSSVAQKGITFSIVDERVLQEASGIVQGMSGSPIIQDGKIVGCVTHVSSSDQSTGYGLYIEWMLEMDEQE